MDPIWLVLIVPLSVALGVIISYNYIGGKVRKIIEDDKFRRGVR